MAKTIKSKKSLELTSKTPKYSTKSETNESTYYIKDLKIVETHLEGSKEILDKIETKEFEKPEIFNLKLQTESNFQNSSIDELISYPLIKNNLFYNLPHQQNAALRIMRDLDGRALLADEVGLGKTITAAMVLKECIVRGFVNRALILVPPSLVNQWKQELIEKFELDFKIIEKEDEWTDTNFAIASIDRVKNFNLKSEEFKHSAAHEIYWDIIIIDEAHKLKNKKTNRYKFVDRLQKKRLLLLTATPFQNDLIELYNLLSLLKRGHLGTLTQFRRRFLLNGNERSPLNPKELKSKLDEIMIRRSRGEVKGIKYMKRIPKIIPIELTIEEKSCYETVMKLLLNYYFDYKGNQINNILAMHAVLPKITSSSRSSLEFLENLINNPKYSKKTHDYAKYAYDCFKDLNKDTKIDTLMKLVDEIFANEKNKKLLVYTKHPATMRYITEKLKEKNIKVTEYFGGLTAADKSKRILEFEFKTQVLVSTDTGSEGINLQFCNNLINYDLPWNPMVVEQRIGRLDRIGQKFDINVWSLATKDTMEEHIVDLIINKMCCIGLIMGELPIILFNMGLDSKGFLGSNKFEEKLMTSFLYSSGNLSRFETEIDKFKIELNKGINEYDQSKINNKKLFSEK